MNQEILRQLPKIDEMMLRKEIKQHIEEMSHDIIKRIVQEEIDEVRNSILKDEFSNDGKDLDEVILKGILSSIENSKIRSLRPVINATGVVLHTNLGRANLSEDAKLQVNSVMDSYSTLEYNPIYGKRGHRHDHVEKLLCTLTGAEAAMVVNNNAAATMLVLSAMGRGKEFIVSRGELVEIGGSFRIPDIMEESGAKLIEVGTTNKTRLKDYKKKISDNTAALLKVHTSNYKIIGFTEEAGLKELKELGEKYNLPLIYDMGLGLMVDLKDAGIDEPVVRDGLEKGADVVLFSGDKLLGGPQAGIIVGKKEYIDMMKSHPLARVLRVDKLTFSALESTLNIYLDSEKAKKDIPVLRMITRTEEELTLEAEKLKKLIDETGEGFNTEIVKSEGPVGGGSAPGAKLKNVAVAVSHSKLSAASLDEYLRQGKMPIVIRIHEDRVLFEMRTLNEKEYDIISEKLKDIVRTQVK